ncbi:MAG: DNA replication/repair protein RecF [Bacillota bacterium]
MVIDKISFQGFRNLHPLEYEPQKWLNLIYGENAQGKTNFLEGIYFSATARSIRTNTHSQLIAFEEKESHLQVHVTSDHGRKSRIDVHLRHNEKKAVAIDGLPLKQLGELFGTLYTVMFSPEDLALVKDSPNHRRRFIDMELCQTNKVYYHNLQQYHKILKQRNNLLKQIQKKPKLEETISVWDEQLIQYGISIIKARTAFLERLGILCSQNMKTLTGGKDTLTMEYQPNCTKEQLANKIRDGRKRDILLGSTQYGPHKDDMDFLIAKKKVRLYGSQGQQRSTALAVKLAQIDFIKEETGESPVLLLDDVFSELDSNRQQYLMQYIGGLQSFLTCTGVEDWIRAYVDVKDCLRIENGKIEEQ